MMNQAIQNQLVGIMQNLQQNCQSAIKLHAVILAPTSGQSGYHFMVPKSSGKQLIAWGAVLNYSRKFGINNPCVRISLDASLLNKKDPVYIKHYNPDGMYGRGGEVQLAVCKIGSSDYKLAERALIEAARNLLSGTRYNW